MLRAPQPRTPSGSSAPSSASSGRSSPVSEAFSGFSADSDVSSSNTSTSSLFDTSCTRHDRLGAWFLGPKAENIGFLKQFLNSVADETERARLAYQPNDPKFIGQEMQASSVFQKEMSELDVALKELVGALAEHSIPFWSPRYNAHMNGDTSLPGMLGYLAAALFNPNNVCTESSPLTSVIERDVGLQLCQMLGYDISNTESSKPWGHIVCGGSVANLESMWSARNMKFYPLSVASAMEPGASLDFIRDEFTIELCNGETKLFSQATAWELLNLKPETVFDIPERLQNEYAISAGALSAALNPYLIQTCGKDVLEKKFNIKPSKYFVGTTKHYSWPKGAEIQTCLFRNTVTSADYKFIVQGTDKLYLSMLPMFNHANFRHQLILSCEVPEDVMASYREAKKEDPSAVFMMSTASPVELSSILAGSFKGVLQKRLAAGIELTFGSTFEVSNIQVIKNKPLDSKYLDLSYSDEMYFYLYGTPSQQHIEHVLVASKNVQLTSDQVSLDLSSSISEEDLARGVLVRMDRLRESVVLPVLPPHTPTFFKAGSRQRVTVFRDPHASERYGPGLTEAYASASPIATGTIKFGEMVYADSVELNSNPLPKGVMRPKPKDVSRMTLAERLDAARANFAPAPAPARPSPQPIVKKKRHVVEIDHNALVARPVVKAGFNGLFLVMMCLFVLASVVYRPF
ncbi:hypothetical protein RSOLAG22IIIB_11727 [Rhizoctonia solani]|uniref:Uncharacterized protein n=1 Tax=Rhizoctonia solani TaxID=456999 RepID=A0A0K6G9Z7_9AGAM|nr:hypothetical protein RSOLAG22IIIB_11727 [Rhizoctonia solani]